MGRTIAVVGAGPSGFYVAAALLRADDHVRVDILERLPTPYGLVRSGVAPDHPKVKTVVRAFERTARDPRCRFLGNVELGRHLQLDALLAMYDQVALAVGAPAPKMLDIPGSSLRGVHPAAHFVGWYNAHPDHAGRRFDLDILDIAVIGMGNVALDVARILSSPVERLATTDIHTPALRALARGARHRIHVLGRRGPVQAAFTPKEVQEIAAMEGVALRARPAEVELDPASARWLEERGTRSQRRNVEIVRAAAAAHPRQVRTEVWLRFRVSPVAFLGDEQLAGITLDHNALVERGGRIVARPSGHREQLACGAAFVAVGYRPAPIPGVSLDPRLDHVPNRRGRVLDENGQEIPDLFVVGWARRGPRGLIGANRADAAEVARTMLALPVQRPASVRDPLPELERRTRVVRWADWEKLDTMERTAGEREGRPRVKFAQVETMLDAIDRGKPSASD